MRAFLSVVSLLFVLSSIPLQAQPVVLGANPVTPDASAEGQRQSSVAAGEDGFLVVWQSGLGGSSSIRGARVGLDGQSLDPAGFEIASAAGGLFEPVVAYGHGIFFVVWSDMRDGDHAIYGARVALDGTVLDQDGRPYSTESTTARVPSVAATESGFVLAWAQAGPTGHGFVPRALRLDSDGAPVEDEPLKIVEVGPWEAGEDFPHSAFSEAICQHVRVAVQGATAAIFWGGTAGRQQGYFIERAFLNLEGWTVSLPPDKAIIDASSRIHSPEVVAFGQGFLFSWLDYRGRGQMGLADANAALIDVDGTVTPIRLSDEDGGRKVLAPALSSNGLVAFVDPAENPQLSRRMEYHTLVREIRPDGSSDGETEVEVNAAWPALATHSSGISLLVTTRINAATRNGMLDVRLVTVD